MLSRFTADELCLAIDGSEAGFWVWDLEADDVRWSSQLGKIYCLEAANFPDNFDEFSALLPPSTGDKLKDALTASVDHVNGRFKLEHKIIRPNGKVGWVRNCGHVELDKNRSPAKVCVIAIDITEQKLAELSLQEREDHFRRFSELTSDYIFEADMTVQPIVPHVVAGSYERVVGYNSTELAEKGGWTSIIHPEDIDNGMKVWKLLENGVPTVDEYRIVNKHGKVRRLRDHSHPVMQDGKLVKIIGGVKDITETKALQDELLQAKKHEAMAHLSSAVAHDFNNLLLVIRASTELISLESKDLENLKDDVIMACDRAAELTRSLLAFTRKDVTQPRTVRLSKTIDEAKGMLQRAVGEQIRIRIEQSNTANDKVNIDPAHLQLMLLNLATNARAAMSDGGQFVLSISSVASDTIDIPDMKPGNTVVLNVTDSGCGIKDTDLQHIFDPFFTTKSLSEGSGIGLATCWQIIERAGGTIRVNSKVAQGTTFTIYLPTVDTPVYREPETPERYTVGGKEHILVIENDTEVRRVSERILQLHGYAVSGVHSIQAAQRAVADNHYDMLLIDIHLPDGDGIDLINKLGKTNPDLPTLLISGYIDDNTRSKVKAGGHNVLPKPFSAATLARNVRATLARSASATLTD